ncbi:MAG: heme ABC transporter permease [Legionellales bacterium]
MPRWFYQLATPKYFYSLTTPWMPWLKVITLILFSVGLPWGLFWTPTDAQQGEAFRIIYVHVPAAFMSLGVYVFMALNAFIYLVWRIKVADIMVESSAVVGAWFTAITLLTGMLWGKPMWGAWWLWDPRLTFELILLFFYFGYIALRNAIEQPVKAAQISGLWVLIGVVNVPIVHYSVEWWNSIHQGSSINLLSETTIYSSMYYPLLIMLGAFGFYFLTIVLIRARTLCLLRMIKAKS